MVDNFYAMSVRIAVQMRACYIQAYGLILRDTDKMHITSIGNAGFIVSAQDITIAIDPLDPSRGGIPTTEWPGINKLKCIIITHDHWDHCNKDLLVETARLTGSTVIGPATVTRPLTSSIPSSQMITLSPEGIGKSCQAILPAVVKITAFGTRHGKVHNSYLVELPDIRIFHDGDNEHTGCIPVASLGRVDALFIATWQGSGWVSFIEALHPQAWFIMHLTEDELKQIKAGTYFDGLCDHIPLPDRLRSLAPAQTASL